MNEWEKEQAEFLIKIGQTPAQAAPASKSTTKKDEE
jgi:hypothetical protein